MFVRVDLPALVSSPLRVFLKVVAATGPASGTCCGSASPRAKPGDGRHGRDWTARPLAHGVFNAQRDHAQLVMVGDSAQAITSGAAPAAS
ncbi:hypothetical protein EES43_29850 [Streptomyces sp. ADI96-02]|nr:hypothetical protein EES43_29850 [Streptomyces sp. ADI96-02]